MLDGNVGYIPLLQFNETASDELRAALKATADQVARPQRSA